MYVVACQLIKADEEIADQKGDGYLFGAVTNFLVQKKLDSPIIVKQGSLIRLPVFGGSRSLHTVARSAIQVVSVDQGQSGGGIPH